MHALLNRTPKLQGLKPAATTQRGWLQRLLLMILLACLHMGATQAADKSPGLLVMGDSLSAAYGLRVEQGWVHLLSQRMQSKQPAWKVINASISGETTAGGVARIESELKKHEPDLVVIELGANDGLRGLPLDVAAENLKRMVVAAKTSGARVLLIGMRIPPNYGPDYTQAFVAMYEQLSKTEAVPLLPFLMEPIASDRSQFLDDNLHPSADAQPALLDHVWSALEPLLAR